METTVIILSKSAIVKCYVLILRKIIGNPWNDWSDVSLKKLIFEFSKESAFPTRISRSWLFHWRSIICLRGESLVQSLIRGFSPCWPFLGIPPLAGFFERSLCRLNLDLKRRLKRLTNWIGLFAIASFALPSLASAFGIKAVTRATEQLKRNTERSIFDRMIRD